MKTLGALSVAVILASSFATPAVGNDVVAYKTHIIKCFGLLFSDPDRHLDYCGVNDHVPGSLADTPYSHTVVVQTCTIGYLWNGYACVHAYS